MCEIRATFCIKFFQVAFQPATDRFSFRPVVAECRDVGTDQRDRHLREVRGVELAGRASSSRTFSVFHPNLVNVYDILFPSKFKQLYTILIKIPSWRHPILLPIRAPEKATP